MQHNALVEIFKKKDVLIVASLLREATRESLESLLQNEICFLG